MAPDIKRLCIEKGFKITGPREVILQVISDSKDHPDVEEIYRRVAEKSSNIGIATVYRTVRMLEESGIVEKHVFSDGKARYELLDDHHDHLIDVRTGKILEFHNDKIEQLQHEIAESMGYRLVDHRLELYAVPIDDEAE